LPEYRDLVRGDSKFVVNSRLDVKVGLDGVQVLGASASEWVNGGIRVIPVKKAKCRAAIRCTPTWKRRRKTA
jgi:paraquat-inducible protein B